MIVRAGNDSFDVTEYKNLSTIVADRLMEAIHRGELMPGTRLVQTDLAKRFGVSRVAVRDALHRLEQRGIAVSSEGGGVMVMPVTVKRIEDLFLVRAEVESLAVRLAIGAIDDQGQHRLEAILNRQRIAVECAQNQDAVMIDWEFHSAIYSWAANEPLLQVIEILWTQTRQARGLAELDPAWGRNWGARSVVGHRHLLDAIKARDLTAAEQTMRENIRIAQRELADGFRKLGTEE